RLRPGTGRRRGPGGERGGDAPHGADGDGARRAHRGAGDPRGADREEPAGAVRWHRGLPGDPRVRVHRDTRAEARAPPLLHGGGGGRRRRVGAGGRGGPRDRGRAGPVARGVHRGPLRVSRRARRSEAATRLTLRHASGACSASRSGRASRRDRRRRTRTSPTATGCSTTGVPLRRGSKGKAMRIEGRTVLVTGATGGIGPAIARALAARGAKLVLTGRKTDVLGRLARELEAQVFAVDLADRHSLEHLIERTESVDILVANAALPASGRIGALTDA